MKIIFIVWLLLSISHTFAGVNADWVCPKDSSKKNSVEISFDEQGKIVFKPDIFSGTLKTGKPETVSGCIAAFQQQASLAVANYKKEKCPSKDYFCYASEKLFNDRMVDQLKNSNLVKSNSALEVTSVGKLAPVVIDSSISPTEYLESKLRSKELDLKDLNKTFDLDGKRYRLSSFDAVIGKNLDNIFADMSSKEAKQFAQNYLLAKSDILKTSENTKLKSTITRNLNQMFAYIYGDKGEEELTKAIECKPEDEFKPIMDIVKKVQESKITEGCADLNPGQAKVFKQDVNNQYATGDYLLKRKSNGDYQALLNVDFAQSNNSTVSSSSMMNRAKNCLAIASTIMKGPNGEKLELSLLSSADMNALPDDQRPNKKKISIEGPSFKTNSLNYNQDADCAVITHEMLHLLGLCDEYAEDRPYYAKQGWICRVITTAPSVMRNHQVYDQALPTETSCTCSNKTCTSLMNSSDNDNIKIYTGQTALSIIPIDFKKSYCEDSENDYGDIKDSPSKSILIKQDTSNKFVLETRSIASYNLKPFYATFKKTTTCRCPPGDDACLQGKKEILQRAKTPNFTDICPPYADLIKSESKVASSGYSFQNNVLKIVRKPVIKNILQPAHFYKILSGTCPGKADRYNECAAFAYKNGNKSACNVPSRCLDNNYYLGTPQ
jgi:hypothetical protein